MSPHAAIVAVGPASIRRLCCGPGSDCDGHAQAMDAVDDPTALVDGRPVATRTLWRAALASLLCADSERLIVVHPSWWSAWRIGVVTAFANDLADLARHVEVRPRSWLLALGHPEPVAVVEIAERVVAIVDADAVGVPRVGDPLAVAEQVAGVIDGNGTVLIDAPSSVPGAAELAGLIDDVVRLAGRTVTTIDDERVLRQARIVQARPMASEPIGPRRRVGTRGRFVAAGVVLASIAPLAPLAPLASMAPVTPVAPVTAVGRPGPTPPAPAQSAPPTTFLVEGRVVVTVPANWPTQRVTTGPGSARVQVTSPSDPELALHLTQSPVGSETLGDAAERLKRAIDAEPTGVFVDFNPSGSAAGRPAVTYREVRPAHQVRWAVLLDGTVRISVGCQSRPGDDGAIRDACEQAVRTAHAVG